MKGDVNGKNQQGIEQSTNSKINGRGNRRENDKSNDGTYRNDIRTGEGPGGQSTLEYKVRESKPENTYNIVKNAKINNPYGVFSDIHIINEYKNMKNYELNDSC